MIVTNVVLHSVSVSTYIDEDVAKSRLTQALLSPGGRFYLVAVEQNMPGNIVTSMRHAGLSCEVCHASSTRVGALTAMAPRSL